VANEAGIATLRLDIANLKNDPARWQDAVGSGRENSWIVESDYAIGGLMKKC
jgi:hypothetical protein